MKKIQMLAVSMVAFIIGFGVNNIAMSDIESQKIAVVDVGEVVAKSSLVQNLKKEQNKEMNELHKWLKSAQADVDKQKTQEDKDKLLKKYQDQFNKKKSQIAKNYKQKLIALDKNINDAIISEAKNKGYNIVLSKNAVLYGGDDITSSVQKIVK